MLAYTRDSVQGVGFALGFDDPAYFSRFFQRGTGLAPSVYRARLEVPRGADGKS
jgi:AraC-like DNA-binding protein